MKKRNVVIGAAVFVALVFGMIVGAAGEQDASAWKVLFARVADERPTEFIDALADSLQANLTGPQVITIRDDLAARLGLDADLVADEHGDEIRRIVDGLIRLGLDATYAGGVQADLIANGVWTDSGEGEGEGE